MVEKQHYQSAFLEMKDKAEKAPFIYKGKAINYYNSLVEKYKLDVPLITKK